MRPVTRITPQLPTHAMKTYGIVAPLTTHFREASCAEVGCDAHLNGWKTVIDSSTELGARQLNYIRLHSGRKYNDVTGLGTTMVTLLFAAGQKCFRQHRMPLDREPLYVVRGGDWRGNPRGESLRHKNAENWLDDFANHQDRLATRLDQG